VRYIAEVSDRSRIALAVCWIIVAGLLVRMALGGSLLGILYVVRVVHPMVLLVGACSVLIAGGLTFRVLTRPSRGTLWVSTGLSLLVIPFSLVLAGDGHGSAEALGGSAVAALAVAIHSLGRSQEPVTSTEIMPDAPEAGDQRRG
jgi:hypothetical protein